MRGIARRGAVTAAAGLTVLAMTGCTTISSLTTTPTITDLPSRTDEITPTVTPSTPGTGPGGTPASGAKAGGTTQQPSAPRTGPAPGPLQSTERLVFIEDLGVAFAVPTLFTEIDPGRLADAALGSPELQEAARRLGISPAQLRNGILNQIDRLYAGAGANGFQSTVIAARTPMDGLPAEPELRDQLRHGLGTEIEQLTAVRTAAGPGIVATYSLSLGGRATHGRVVLVDTGDGVVALTVTTGSAQQTAILMGRAAVTLRHAA